MNRKARRAARSQRQHRRNQAQSGLAYVTALAQQGWQLLAAGRDQDATVLAIDLIRQHEDATTRALFLDCMQRWTYFPGAEALAGLLTRALRESWERPHDILALVAGMLGRRSALQPALQRAARNWPRLSRIGELFDGEDFAAIAGDELLLALLECGRVADVALERVLTCIRADLLRDHSARQRDDAALRFACALARQCFGTEYVWQQTDAETTQLAECRNRMADTVSAGGDVAPLTLAVLACYQRLDSLPFADAIARRRWPAAITPLLDQQIRQPAAERRERGAIRVLTAIADTTSLRVRDQYEESPYPKWMAPPAPPQPLSLDAYCATEFPHSAFKATGKSERLEILIAGCGTGSHAVRFARHFPLANILAVDLSLASLAYARRKTAELGIRNIDYAQADLLALPQTGRSFDLISSAGVLHHLADPLSGWRALVSLLRPGGCMQIGLYSETARRHVVALQALLRRHGFSASAEDIRRARQELALLPEAEAHLAEVVKFWDFFVTSECRDLLFPAQESRFSIPALAEFLKAHGLSFLGFTVNDRVKAAFAARFSAQRAAELSAWHEFERDNPDTFKAMYEFWVQRAA